MHNFSFCIKIIQIPWMNMHKIVVVNFQGKDGWKFTHEVEVARGDIHWLWTFMGVVAFNNETNFNVELATWECGVGNVDLRIGQCQTRKLAKWTWQIENVNLGNLDLIVWQKWSLQRGKVNLAKYSSIQYLTWWKQLFRCMMGQSRP